MKRLRIKNSVWIWSNVDGKIINFDELCLYICDYPKITYANEIEDWWLALAHSKDLNITTRMMNMMEAEHLESLVEDGKWKELQ